MRTARELGQTIRAWRPDLGLTPRLERLCWRLLAETEAIRERRADLLRAEPVKPTAVEGRPRHRA